jgi:preprotein translocase subunit SecG
MYQFLLAIHVTTAILLVVFILLQQGKGATTGASFGSGASTTLFGSSGSAGFMSRTTWFLVAVFFVVNLALAYLTNSYMRQDSLQDLRQIPIVAPDSEIPDQMEQEADTSTGQSDPSDVPE